jgi:hypothetical protein
VSVKKKMSFMLKKRRHKCAEAESKNLWAGFSGQKKLFVRASRINFYF